MKTSFAALALSLLSLTGCDSASEFKELTKANLKDPDSAKFGRFTRVKDQACLTVNAKNSMGGYTGDQQAYLAKMKDDKWVLINISKWSHDQCVELIAKK